MNFERIIIVALWFYTSSSKQSKEPGRGSSNKIAKETVTKAAGRISNQSVPISQRIIGGERAGQNEFRYIVAISDTLNREFNGAGAIIAPQWILTAWHVFDAATKKRGANMLVTPKYDNRASVNRHKKRYIASEYFCPRRGGFFNGDLTLVKLREPIPLNRNPYRFDRIQMIEADRRLDLRRKVTIVGWGRDKLHSYVPSEFLLKVDVNVTPNRQCQYAPGKFCTIGGKFGQTQGSCHGDSGGPVVIRNGNSDILVGLVSGGADTCQSVILGHIKREFFFSNKKFEVFLLS